MWTRWPGTVFRQRSTSCASVARAERNPRPPHEKDHVDVVDGDPAEASDYADQAVRMLRSGGALAVNDALWHDRVADPARRDEDTVAIRDLGRTVAEREDLVPVLLPVSGGLLCALKK